jgi:hypothetical protein
MRRDRILWFTRQVRKNNQMNAQDLADVLLEWNIRPPFDWLMIEASAHRPRRGTRFVASYRDEHGNQRWKGTGLTEYELALKLAQRWEAEARRKRASRGPHAKVSGTGRGLGGLTQSEVAAVLQISVRAVREIEQRAIEKLRQHPELKRVWQEFLGAEVEESAHEAGAYRLNFAEVLALFLLTATPFERQALTKLVTLADEQ